jgi:hypothetical protein
LINSSEIVFSGLAAINMVKNIMLFEKGSNAHGAANQTIYRVSPRKPFDCGRSRLRENSSYLEHSPDKRFLPK